jgi:hypothetical protein
MNMSVFHMFMTFMTFIRGTDKYVRQVHLVHISSKLLIQLEMNDVLGNSFSTSLYITR